MCYSVKYMFSDSELATNPLDVIHQRIVNLTRAVIIKKNADEGRDSKFTKILIAAGSSIWPRIITELAETEVYKLIPEHCVVSYARYGAPRELTITGYTQEKLQQYPYYNCFDIAKQNSLEIVKVIFNYPATIVFWSDGDKTVVKCSLNDTFDEEKGLAMAIAKKCLGTNEGKSNYNDIFKKWVPKKKDFNSSLCLSTEEALKATRALAESISKAFR